MLKELDGPPTNRLASTGLWSPQDEARKPPDLDEEVKEDRHEDNEEDEDSAEQMEFDEHSPNFKTHYVHRKWKRFALRSLWCFSYKNKCRYRLVWFVEWRWFEIFITLLIILNSIFLGVYDYKT